MSPLQFPWQSGDGPGLESRVVQWLASGSRSSFLANMPVRRSVGKPPKVPELLKLDSNQPFSSKAVHGDGVNNHSLCLTLLDQQVNHHTGTTSNSFAQQDSAPVGADRHSLGFLADPQIRIEARKENRDLPVDARAPPHRMFAVHVTVSAAAGQSL